MATGSILMQRGDGALVLMGELHEWGSWAHEWRVTCLAHMFLDLIRTKDAVKPWQVGGIDGLCL